VSMQKAFVQQNGDDIKSLEERKPKKPDSSVWAISPPLPPTSLQPFHFCRMLLSHLGFIHEDSDCELVENNKNFQLKFNHLDKTYNRETQKIGIIYVKDGQDDQHEILKNNSASNVYKEFVQSLGWMVELENHKGYTGGLHGSVNGSVAPYYNSSVLEIAFHDVICMPTVPEDPQQLHKKRHVGNDMIHIIWSEHGRDYSPNTITSQFNDAHIIVYPLPNGLFRIQVAKKEKLTLFGPLLHGMIVNKKILPYLVRQTAINACRSTRSTEGKQYSNRYSLIQEILVKCVPKKADYPSFAKAVIKPEGTETPTSPKIGRIDGRDSSFLQQPKVGRSQFITPVQPTKQENPLT